MTKATAMEAVELPPLPAPSAWVNFNVLTQKERLDRMPITSIQPGVFQHAKLYSEDKMSSYALASLAAKEAEVVVLREALQGFMRNSTRFDWPDDIYDAAENAITQGAQS